VVGRDVFCSVYPSGKNGIEVETMVGMKPQNGYWPLNWRNSGDGLGRMGYSTNPNNAGTYKGLLNHQQPRFFFPGAS
jgi:hypothetical protein